MNRKNLNLEGVTYTQLGNINADAEGEQLESSIELSEKNFRLLLSLIPKTNEYQAVKNSIQSIKDKLTELNYKTTAELNRSLLISYLKDELEYQQFIDDITKFNKDSIKLVGKIDLNNMI